MSADSQDGAGDEIVSGLEFGPQEMAAAFVKRPGLYVGFPPSHERVAAFINGFDMALLMAGEPTSLLSAHRDEMRVGAHADHSTPEQEHQRIQALRPALEAVFTTAARLKAEHTMPRVIQPLTIQSAVDELIASLGPSDHSAEIETAVRLEAERLVQRKRPGSPPPKPEARSFLVDSGAFTAESYAQAYERVARGELRASEQRAALQVIAASCGESEVAELLGIDSEDVQKLRNDRQLFAFDAAGIAVYPRWQFTEQTQDHRLPHLAHVIETVPEDWHPASLHGFMTTPQDALDHRGRRLTPIRWLLEGREPERIDEILEAIRWR